MYFRDRIDAARRLAAALAAESVGDHPSHRDGAARDRQHERAARAVLGGESRREAPCCIDAVAKVHARTRCLVAWTLPRRERALRNRDKLLRL
jgi:hypothetical protein